MYDETIEALEASIARMENSDEAWACVEQMRDAVAAMKEMDEELRDLRSEIFMAGI